MSKDHPYQHHTDSTKSVYEPPRAGSRSGLVEGDSNCDRLMDIECSLANQCSTACDEPCSEKAQPKSICFNQVGQCVWGILLVLVSIGGFVFTPLDFMLWEKMNMRPGFPPFEWWLDPPDEVKMRVYVFNITNHERFLSGLDDKINVQEIGPIVYLEKLVHSNVHFNENSTMTYTARRYPVYLPAVNHVDLNATLIIPNMAVLGFASYLHDAPYFVRMAFRMLINTHSSTFFSKRTIYEYLWEYYEPVSDTTKALVPGIVPVRNLGLLSRVYEDFTDVVTVKVGPQWGHNEFFQIDRFGGQPQLPGYDPHTCPDRIFGSTEGIMYHQHIKKEDVLLYWRKTVCKLMPVYFESEVISHGILTYRFNLTEMVYARTSGTDCYDTVPSLPDGVSDASNCYFGYPMVMSYPHFYTGDPPKDRFVTGLQPDRNKHNSYLIVEPLTGIPFRSVARMQSNLRVHDLSGFSTDYHRFSNIIVPLMWIEYNQEDLPDYIIRMVYFMTVILPPLSSVLLLFFLFLGCYILAKQIYIHDLHKYTFKHLLQFKSDENKKDSLVYEKRTFLNRPS